MVVFFVTFVGILSALTVDDKPPATVAKSVAAVVAATASFLMNFIKALLLKIFCLMQNKRLPILR